MDLETVLQVRSGGYKLTKKAFTLIELLVVIAIIAILAAILFPVFAQAKLAAKGAASISNSKQLNLAHIMYAGDYDDVFTLANVWDSPTANLSISGVNYNTWVWNIYPYMKNADILQDPLGPPITTAGFASKINQASATPTYGYNYTWLSPSYFTGGVWQHTAVSQSSLGQPSSTVMLTDRYEQASETSLAATQLLWYGVRSITTLAAVDPPDCQSAVVTQYCFDNWGNNTVWTNTTGVNIKTVAAGRLTGGNALRGAEQCIVSMADGSAKKMKASALAAGTNWRQDTTFNGSTLVVNDNSKYLWDNQ